ncbi:MAG: type II toxin-antitoxin system VapC family toxin [Proteobacteria bacterium]|nr:type II toxin-antitoxin system VapC family toxin [Pseudomonadota bacterium]
MLYDTDFFIHLSGRTGRRNRSAVTGFLEAHSRDPLFTSRVCWEELAEGVLQMEVVDDLLAEFSVIEIDEDIAWLTSRAARTLKQAGQHIGDNDCWIAGTALAKGLPIVTRNIKHFQRVPGLEVITF